MEITGILSSEDKNIIIFPGFPDLVVTTFSKDEFDSRLSRVDLNATNLFIELISVGIIILGALIAGARDLSFDAYGYAVVFTANICTAIYLASIARIGKSSGLNSFGLMWCNGIICAPILLLWTSVRGDLEVTMNFPLLFYPGFQVVMLFSCILAFLINYYVFLNTALNSALTQTICGNLKDLFTIGIGWLLFGGLPFDLSVLHNVSTNAAFCFQLNVVGQSLGFLGSCLYAYCKFQGK
ncbi:hypothetical protein JRO89_XS03G0290600 [Xanthoceras sorbifolium]|uniref:Uncharacterized protein n=1 Tax=Xanthoceras sorbifolium TaxID=99658 RepID=A0ABQ8ICV6_9ROSI|nr:hypothetical protein JRO89_XS03G0290600 [Xanthoceras sorbifolium]